MLRVLALVLTAAVRAQDGPPPAVPAEPVTAIIEAFRTHDIVALCDAHGNRQSQMFLQALVRDPRFPTVANEIPVDETFFQTVRAVNATLPPERRIRVLLSDPPIDWTSVKTREDHLTARIFAVWQFSDELAKVQADVSTASAA